MERYTNIGGGSGVVAYETGSDFIRVQFSDGWVYTYTHSSCGVENCEHMKSLAVSGRGLNSFINRSVRTRYERKER